MCCIPIIVDHLTCIDVRVEATPEMEFGPGFDIWGKPLDEPEAMRNHLQGQPKELIKKLGQNLVGIQIQMMKLMFMKKR